MDSSSSLNDSHLLRKIFCNFFFLDVFHYVLILVCNGKANNSQKSDCLKSCQSLFFKTKEVQRGEKAEKKKSIYQISKSV